MSITGFIKFGIYSVCQVLLHIQFLFRMEEGGNYARHACHEGKSDQARSVWEIFYKNAFFALARPSVYLKNESGPSLS